MTIENNDIVTPQGNGDQNRKRDVVGIRLQQASKVQFCDPSGLELVPGDLVVVQTKHGPKIGKVAIAPQQILVSELMEAVQPLLRKATPEDVEQSKSMKAREDEALAVCKELVAKQALAMKILSTESNLTGDHFTVYFTAPEKVDFRKLARDLASRLRSKIEIRQVGPRDATKILGGLGRCGSALCCATFLTEFNPVSVKMAKEQNVSLDPMKNSGACGRLLCCLGYEAEHYRSIAKKLPRQNAKVETSAGSGKVVAVNILKETVCVQLESNTVVEVSCTDIIRSL